jgi:hypothetical protein
MSKAGQADIRRLLIIGAMTRVRWASRKPPAQGAWLSRMLARKPRMLVADRTGKQNGSENMGHADQTGRLSKPGLGCDGVTGS